MKRSWCGHRRVPSFWLLIWNQTQSELKTVSKSSSLEFINSDGTQTIEIGMDLCFILNSLNRNYWTLRKSHNNLKYKNLPKQSLKCWIEYHNIDHSKSISLIIKPPLNNTSLLIFFRLFFSWFLVATA